MSKPSAYHTQNLYSCNIASFCCQQDVRALPHLRGCSELGEQSGYPDHAVQHLQKVMKRDVG